MKEKKILVVDDNEDILLATSLILESAGYSVETSQKLDPVKKITPSTAPQLILLDMFLNGGNGTEITRKLKSQDSTCQIPIILVSGHGNVEKSAEQCGADAFLYKPFGMDQLLAVVERLIVN